MPEHTWQHSLVGVVYHTCDPWTAFIYIVLLYYTLHMRMAVYVSDAFVDLIDFSFVVV